MQLFDAPLFDRPLFLSVALGYLALVLGVGFWAVRRTRTSKDFFIAGQDVGVLVTGMAAMSAAFSGFVFLGGPGLTYRLGIAAAFINVPLGFTAGMLCWVVGKRLRLLAEVHEVYTVPDAVYHRYRSRRAAALAALAVLVGTLAYLGAQLLALGRLIEALFDTRALFGTSSLPAATAIGLLIVLLYAVGGGMLAGVYTDLVQGLLMVSAAVLVFGVAVSQAGGLPSIGAALSGADMAGSEPFGAGFLDPLAGVPIFTALGFYFVFGLGTLGQPHMLHKFYMLDDPRKLKWMPWILGGSQAMCVLIWLGIGLAVPTLVVQGRMEPLVNADDAAPAFLLGFAPEWLAGLVFAGVLAAIMSTADSFVNLAAAALVRDLPRALGRPLRRELAWARVATLVVAVAAAGVALAYDDLIALLGTFGFGTFGAALGPALAVGLNWKRVTATAASWSIGVGLVLNVALEFLARQSYFPQLPRPAWAPGVLPTAVSLAASFTVLFAVTWWTTRHKPAEELDPRVAAVMEI